MYYPFDHVIDLCRQQLTLKQNFAIRIDDNIAVTVTSDFKELFKQNHLKKKQVLSEELNSQLIVHVVALTSVYEL